MKDIKYTLYNHQEECVKYSKDHDKFILADGMGLGKALTLDSKLYTKDGYILMKDVKVGASLLDEEGNCCNVIGVYPQGVKSIYEVTFSDGATVKCCKEHLWSINTVGRNYLGKPYMVKSLEEIVMMNHKGIVNLKGINKEFDKFMIPITRPIDFNKKELPVDPYTLGISLADVGEVSDDYLFTTLEDRKRLLQGILDGYGRVSSLGDVVCTTFNEYCTNFITELVQGLGGICKVSSINYTIAKGASNTLYVLYIYLPRDFNPEWCNPTRPPQRFISSIEYLGEEECQCIAVDSPNRLFLTDGYVVTHNTLQALCVAVDKKKVVERCLIICCVNGMQYSWEKEIQDATYEKVRILGNRLGKRTNRWAIKDNKEKLEDLNNLGDEYFLITNIQALRDVAIKKRLHELCRSGEIKMCIVDEPHLGISSPRSQQGKNIHEITCKYKMLLTGTPLMNSPMDLYNLLKWIGAERYSYRKFEDYYARKGGYGGYQIIGYKHLEELQDILGKNMLRRKKDDVLDLPPKIYKYEYVDMYPEQKKLYKETKEGIIRDMDEILEVNPNPLAMLTGLRQVTECPQLVNENITKCAKLDRMVELVDEIVSNGEKVLIFSNWSKVIREAYKLIDPNYNAEVITGEVKVDDRQRIKDDFQSTSDCKVLLGTIGAMGTGLTLTAATNVIFISEPWNYANKVQAEDRIYRIGQEHVVNIITIITNDTVDEGVHQINMTKKDMSDALVDNKVEGKDLKRLFRNLLK